MGTHKFVAKSNRSVSSLGGPKTAFEERVVLWNGVLKPVESDTKAG